MMDDRELQPAAEAHQDELWLVSYADLLTLLLGFFVLIVASVPLQQSRFEKIAAAISGAEPPPLETLQRRVEKLLQQSPALRESVRVSEDERGLGIELRDTLLFDSGSAEVRPDGRAVIGKVAALLAGLPERPVSIEGHTDDLPIHTRAFESNWELSAARAIRVLHALEASGVARARLSARAFGDTREAATAADERDFGDRRSSQRRVVIRVE
jgi:chemotaxis protein MotB